jgi:CopG family nickel-responsive transcriptional regulator
MLLQNILQTVSLFHERGKRASCISQALSPAGGHIGELCMSNLVRFGISLNEDLLESFDKLCEGKNYASRSEAIRDLIRKALIEERWNNDTDAVGTLTLVYNYHKNDLARRMMDLQHEAHDVIISTMRVQLDYYNCLEVLVLRGDPKRIRIQADRLISCRGVKHGTFVSTAAGQDLA